MTETYKIVRGYRDHYKRRVVARGLTLDKAQEHCSNPETSSATATNSAAKLRTKRFGPWFDGYEKE